MKFQSITSPLIPLITTLVTVSAQADPYNFGGSCPSQGAWTQMALQQTQQIADVIRQLKDNPACKGIESVVFDLKSATDLLNTPKDEIVQESRMESLPTEITALRGAMIDNGNLNSGAANMLMNRTLQAAQISSQLNQNATPNPQAIASGPSIKSLFTRYAAPTRKGMELVSRIFQVLPKFDECLIGQPQQGMALLSGAVKVAAAFSAAGEGVGNSLGDAISNLTTMLRDRRFTLALRKQDETQFWLSVSCLLESTAKNYCDAQGAQEILQYSKDQYIASMKRNLEDRKNPNYDNPLEGYYLLVRELPLISAWLQQVQFGVAPKLLADAGFKNKIWSQVTDLTQTVNALLGYFNEQMLFMRELTDPNAKRNQLFSMIGYLVDQMVGAGDNASTSSAQFFTTTMNASMMPFYLIGLDSIPEECRSNSSGKIVMDWQGWMKTGGNNGGFQAQFSDPDKLASVIQTRMNDIIAGASAKSSAYFRQRLIVDMPNLVNQTLTGQYMTVHKSFENVYNYLVRFETKLNKDQMDLIMIPSVRETRTKIKKFLKSYEKLRSLGADMVKSPNQTEELLAQVNTAATDVIDTIFTEFNVLFQKDTFLTNRLTTYIDKDFSMRIRTGLNMTPYQNDLMVITQKHLLEKLTEVNGLNPTSASLDLNQAQVVNKRNIEVLEEVFKDSLYRMILEVKSVADGKGRTEVTEYLQRKYEEERDLRRKVTWSMPDALGGGFYGWLTAGSQVRSDHPDLYQDRTNALRVTGSDDKFKSFGQFQAKLCAQTLSFEDRGYFYDLCKGTVLKSYYSGAKGSALDLRYDEYMPNANAGAGIRRNPIATAKSICAFEHFTIQNMVKRLKDQDADMYREESTF